MNKLTKEEKVLKLILERQKRILLSQESFWEFCMTESPTFYKEDRWHLNLICHVLQALYERRLTKEHFRELCEQIAPVWYINTFDWDRLIDGHIYTKIMENIPPRHGKSRTLVNFCKWTLGKNKQNRIITCSYNDDLATSFSRYTRDGITEKKNLPSQIVYSDIFPESKIKHGNASYQEWALEGEFFNYKGSGVGGSITGKGCNISIVDDPVKDAEVAYNINALEKIWLWYTGTFLSRQEDSDDGCIEIVNMTRWAKGDICGKILADAEAREWLILSMEACTNGEMLCPTILSKRKYDSLERTMDEAIFKANYHQEPVDIKGKLYQQFKTYTSLPVDENGESLIERIISYTDTADEGDNYLCSIVAGEYQKEIYLIDVLYSKAGMEITEPATAKMLHENEVNVSVFESNNGGRGFARSVQGILLDKYKTRRPSIKWFHQSKNKIARILSNATYIMDHVYFPANWRDRWPEYYNAMTTFQREGKNKVDDAPDCTTGLVELVNGKIKIKFSMDLNSGRQQSGWKIS